MKKTVVISLFFMTFLVGQAQNTNKESIKVAETELQKAVEDQDYKKAAALKDEIAKRKEIEAALEAEDYDKASELKKELKSGGKDNEAAIQRKIEAAIEAEDYEKAARLKKQLESGSDERVEDKASENREPTRKISGSAINYSTTKSIEGFVAPSEGKSVVYFINPFKNLKFEYFHEDRFIGKFKGKNYFRYECEPGSHLFWASSENKEFLTADLKAGRVYVVEVSYSMGWWKQHVRFLPIEEGSKRLKKLVKVVAKKPVSKTTKRELKKRNWELKPFIREHLKRYQEEYKYEKDFKHILPDSDIPLEVLKSLN